MADINYSVNASLSRGSLNSTFVASGVTADCSNSGVTTQTLTPGTNAAGTVAISTATMSAVGLFFARNLSTVSTATVSFGQLSAGSLVPTITLKGGEAAVGRLASGSYAAIAATTGTQLVISIVEG